MILKNSLILISLIAGVIVTTVTAYFEYEDEASRSQIDNSPMHLQAASLNNMDMDMDARTEVSMKNVRNISDNQLSNEFTATEHEHEQHQHADINEQHAEHDKRTSMQTTEQSINSNSKEEDYETEIPLNKKNRTSRLFTTTMTATAITTTATSTTTTIPQYIRRSDEENPILIQKDINASTSDYIEDDIMDHLQRHTTKMPFNKNLDNSSEENDETAALAMKYYHDIQPENVFSGRHVEELSSEDYYEDEYHDPESTTTPPDNNSLRSLSSTGIRTSTPLTKTTTTTTTTTTPTQSPSVTALPTNFPIISQFPSDLLTTLVPLLPQSQTQTILPTTTSGTASGAPAAADAAASAAAAPDKKGKQIPIINTSPVAKTTTSSSRRRLLPHEQLRNYIEDAYIRMPLAVIVDPSAESLEKTKTLWNDALRTNLNIKIVLVTLNESHESPAAFNFNNTRQFLAGLNSIKEQNSGDAFRGISHAAELVPYDSAVFISTAQLAKHTDQVQDSAITLLKKRIRLYLIWFGERSLSENETQDSVGGILGEVAIRSGGEILHLVSSENSQELEGSTLTIVADALRGSHEVDVPVDTTLSSLHVKIDKLMRRAVLETPNGG